MLGMHQVKTYEESYCTIKSLKVRSSSKKIPSVYFLGNNFKRLNFSLDESIKL